MKLKTDNYITICPKCKSTEVKDRGMIGAKAYSNMHVCQSCGFTGPIFPEIPMEEARKLPKQQINFNPSTMPIFADKVDDVPFKEKSLKQKIIWGIVAALVVASLAALIYLFIYAMFI